MIRIQVQLQVCPTSPVWPSSGLVFIEMWECEVSLVRAEHFSVLSGSSMPLFTSTAIHSKSQRPPDDNNSSSTSLIHGVNVNNLILNEVVRGVINSSQWVYSYQSSFCLFHSAVFHRDKGFSLPTSWNALITVVQLPREPLWYSILLFPIPPISFTLDTWHLHNVLVPFSS